MTLWLMIAFLVLFPVVAGAGSVTLVWDPVTGATGYEIEQSTDNGTTWTIVQNITSATACTGTPVSCKVVHAAPATGRVLFRFVAKNASGRTVREKEGAWHCETCGGPGTTANVGTQ